ncbi:MAG: hypothetical protein KAY37_12020 [Phycisphaerae bacterium]|nr:hypothetical protein [Phycisphaerae bacterium]
MALPPLLHLADEAAYRAHFVATLRGATNAIVTHDGIDVILHDHDFDHAFSAPLKKWSKQRVFNAGRASYMDWIRSVLEDRAMAQYRRVMPDGKTRKLLLEPSAPFIVVIQPELANPTKAAFITAYPVTSAKALAKIRSNPAW